MYFTYMMTNISNHVLYVGVTGNLVKRVYEHREKLVPNFTCKYNITKLVYYEPYGDIREAIKREKSLKNLVRRKKNDLINEFNPDWKDLYQSIV